MQALLPVHVAAGGLAIVVGAVALAATKGAWLHRNSGVVFVAAILAMGLSGSALARPLAVAAMLLALALGSVNLALGFVAAGPPHMAVQGVPAPAFFTLSLVGLLAAAGDFRVISGALGGAPRLARHLWRMCFALFIAAGSFFSIRARVARALPEPFLGAGFRVIAMILPLVLMVFWMWRVRAGRTRRSAGSNAPATA